MEIRDHAPDPAGLAAATVSGDEADAAHLEQVRESDFNLLRGGGRKQIRGFHLVAERMLGEAKVLAVHFSSPPGSDASVRDRLADR
jgi:hypothetical protein